jgi:hypothetical protein
MDISACNWGIPHLLNKIRLNCITLSKRHTFNYLYYKHVSKYFEIPTIVLSVFSGSFAVGSDIFLHQELISVVSCGISIIITILTSIKLYMKINETLSIEQELSIKYKILSLEIYKFLSLTNETRGITEIEYLNKVYVQYIKLVEQSEVIMISDKKDHLIKIDLYDNDDSSSESSQNIIQTEHAEI